MAGRPRKPTALKQLEGTARPDRANALEPQFEVGAPAKPAEIATNRIAAEEWDRIVPLLLATRVLSPAYRSALVGYCLSYAGMVSGKKDAMKEHRQWVSALGLSPTTVSKAKSAPHEKASSSPLAQLQATRRLRAVK
jgi:phage terminase small subunit